jgi:hypothetical protein
VRLPPEAALKLVSAATLLPLTEGKYLVVIRRCQLSSTIVDRHPDFEVVGASVPYDTSEEFAFCCD